jgi:hypothetical protein
MHRLSQMLYVLLVLVIFRPNRFVSHVRLFIETVKECRIEPSPAPPLGFVRAENSAFLSTVWLMAIIGADDR